MTALAHELAGLIGPLHGLGLRIPIVGAKNRAPPDLNAQTPTPPLRPMQPSGEPEKRMRRFTRRSRAGLCRAGGAKSIAGGPRSQPWLSRCSQIVAPPESRQSCSLRCWSMIVEGQITKRDQNDDRNQREQVAAPACLRLLVLAARRGLAHAKRLEARWSMSPSAAIALATMPLASSPAAAYMRSGLS